MHLANLMVQLGEHERATKYFSNCIRVNPDSAAAHFGLMIAVTHQVNKASLAIKHLQ